MIGLLLSLFWAIIVNEPGSSLNHEQIDRRKLHLWRQIQLLVKYVFVYACSSSNYLGRNKWKFSIFFLFDFQVKLNSDWHLDHVEKKIQEEMFVHFVIIWIFFTGPDCYVCAATERNKQLWEFSFLYWNFFRFFFRLETQNHKQSQTGVILYNGINIS